MTDSMTTAAAATTTTTTPRPSAVQDDRSTTTMTATALTMMLLTKTAAAQTAMMMTTAAAQTMMMTTTSHEHVLHYYDHQHLHQSSHQSQISLLMAATPSLVDPHVLEAERPRLNFQELEQLLRLLEHLRWPMPSSDASGKPLNAWHPFQIGQNIQHSRRFSSNP